MAKPWSQVIAEPFYQSLGPDEREAMRQQYFQQVVAPQFSTEQLPGVQKQFDASTGASSTPFGKGVAAAAQQAQAEDAAPPSLGQQAGRAIVRTARATAEGLASIPDIVLGPATYLANKGLEVAGAPDNYRFGTATQALNTAYNAAGVPDLPAQTAAERYADAVARAFGGAGGSVALSRQLEQSASPVIANIGTTLATNPGNQLAAAATGATTAQGAKEAGLGPGAQLAAGVAGSLIPGGASGAANLVGNLAVRPFTQAGQNAMRGNYLGNIAGGTPLTLTESTVPGVQRTLAEASANPGVAQLQRALQNQPENVADFANLAAQNNAARHAYLTQAVGTPEATAALEAERTATTRPLYNLAANMDAEQRAITQGQAEATRAQGRLLPGGNTQATNAAEAIASAVPEQIKPLMNRPAFKQAVKDAADLLAERGQAGVNPLTSVEGLQAIKTSLDNAINKAPTNSAATFDLNAVRNTRALLVKAMQDISPVQREADRAFAQASGPINAQQVGQEILTRGSNKLIDPNTGVPLIQPNAYATALSRGDKIAQQVTGQKNATLADVLSPEQQTALSNVGEDLNRVAYAQNAGRAIGSNTGQNILSANALDSISQAIGIPGLAKSKLAQTLVKPLDKIYNLFGIGDDLKAGLTRVMLDPTSPEAAAVRAAIPAQQYRQLQLRAAPYVNAVRQVQQSQQMNQSQGGR